MNEKITTPLSGFAHLFFGLGLMVLGIWGLTVAIPHHSVLGIWAAVLAILAGITWLCGLFSLEPNQAVVLIFFGKYIGTVKLNGLLWANPFFTKRKISLRAHNLNGKTLKVNDKMGNPIEIASVLVWQVRDTYAALLEVENYETFVETQSESALRHLANSYAYDNMEAEGTEPGLTLRDATEEVSNKLVQELNTRLTIGGIQVLEARISHLSYSPEIAGPMLQRQQATAVISARRQIVEGAVGMVEMALQRLEQHGTVTLDEERKAAMVSNLLVVLCSERSAHPVVNAGSLY